jgi:ferredoxin
MDNIAVIDTDECTDCGQCDHVCPQGAIHSCRAIAATVGLDIDAPLVFKIYGRVVGDPHAPLYRRGLLHQPSVPNIRFDEASLRAAGLT